MNEECFWNVSGLGGSKLQSIAFTNALRRPLLYHSRHGIRKKKTDFLDVKNETFQDLWTGNGVTKPEVFKHIVTVGMPLNNL